MANAPRLSAPPDPARPKKLGRYELEDRLGGEDGAETFRARVRGLAGFDRIFAVKCLHRPRGSQVSLNDPFIKAARRLASLNDPRVARVLDADVIDGVAVAVTEFVHGLDLDRFRECAQFAGVLATGGEEAAVKWQKIVAYVGAEVAGGLAAMHALTPSLVHGGLSPRNIVASARGNIKILDAGLAQAAQASTQTALSSGKRSLSYAAPPVEGVEPGEKGDVRSLGAILFELATGELPPPGSPSAMVRRALDALWPSMADFIASLLAEEPALRPTAEEAAKILSEYWSDVSDASMVSEMAALVRNFSAFVAEVGGPSNTAPPVVQAPPPAPAEEREPAVLTQAEVLSMVPRTSAKASPAIAAAAGEPRKLVGFDDEPTVVQPSGSYAAALFEAAPSSETDEPLVLDDLNRTSGGAAQGPLFKQPPPPPNATLIAYGGVEAAAGLAAGPVLEPASSEPAEGMAPVGFSPLSPAGMSEPIPELADWGARALAALGDQAGVSVAALPPPPPAASSAVDALPPPVSDPAIEEAFAFGPPPSPEAVPIAPMLEAQAEVVPDPETQESVQGAQQVQEAQEVQEGLAVALVPGPADLASEPGEALLEDDLVDEVDGAHPGDEPAVQVDDDPAAAPASLPSPPLTAEAFQEDVAVDEAAPAEAEAPRLAQAMPAPHEAEARRPVARSAARSSSSQGLSAVDEEVLASSTRGRRIALGVVAGLLAGGLVVGALSLSGVLGQVPFFGPQHVDKEPPRLPRLATSQPVEPAAPKRAMPAPSAPPSKAAASTSALPAGKAAAPMPTPPANKPATPPANLPVLAAPTPTVEGPQPHKPSPSQAGASTVSVSITSKPAGASVWVNGEERGSTPCTVKMPAGNARLTLIRAGHLSTTSTFEASEGKAIAEDLKAIEPPVEGDARFRAECKTPGKFPIVVDGRETGIFCPYSKLRVEPGIHRIGILVPSTGMVHEKEITLSAGVRSIVFGD